MNREQNKKRVIAHHQDNMLRANSVITDLNTGIHGDMSLPPSQAEACAAEMHQLMDATFQMFVKNAYSAVPWETAGHVSAKRPVSLLRSRRIVTDIDW